MSENLTEKVLFQKSCLIICMLGIIPGFRVLGMSAFIAGKGTEQDIWGQIRPSGVWEKGLSGV